MVAALTGLAADGNGRAPVAVRRWDAETGTPWPAPLA
jgi:hypothetical protein